MAPFLGVVGGGNMGLAIVRGALAKGVLQASEVLVAEVEAARRAEAAALGCATSEKASDAGACANLLLAVKPQSFTAVAASIGRLRQPRIVISIMAGIGTGRIAGALGSAARVVRVMPNTPCRVGAGATAIARGAGSRPGDEDLAQKLFGALGAVVMVDEAHMHAVTALSGSGPAYVFLLTEAMEAAGRSAGLPPGTAALLARQTVIGAGRLLAETAEDPAALRRAVTSPGGTTEAAIAHKLERDLPGCIDAAIQASVARGKAHGD